MFEEIIGSRLTHFNETGFSIVTLDGDVRNFVFDDYKGECCGYNEIKTELLMSEDDLKGNPVVTNIEMVKHLHEGDGGWDDYGQDVKVTFFGEQKKIAEVNSYSSSESGFCYGACVSVVCKETGESEILSEW